jgi:hypothetical protein
MSLEETFTDKEFCQQFKIDRATSFRWRDDGIVSYLTLPYGQIRYRQRDIDALWEKFGKSALEDASSTVQSGVIDISVSKRGSDVRVS